MTMTVAATTSMLESICRRNQMMPWWRYGRMNGNVRTMSVRNSLPIETP